MAGWFGGFDFCGVPLRCPETACGEALQGKSNNQAAWNQDKTRNFKSHPA